MIITAQESVPFPQDPPVVTFRHDPDIENLELTVNSRIEIMLEAHNPRFLYANPTATIMCDAPTNEFVQAVRESQGKWCKRFRSIFGRRLTRKVKDWFLTEKRNKRDRYLERSSCYTGILIVHDEIADVSKFLSKHR